MAAPPPPKDGPPPPAAATAGAAPPIRKAQPIPPLFPPRSAAKRPPRDPAWTPLPPHACPHAPGPAIQVARRQMPLQKPEQLRFEALAGLSAHGRPAQPGRRPAGFIATPLVSRAATAGVEPARRLLKCRRGISTMGCRLPIVAIPPLKGAPLHLSSRRTAQADAVGPPCGAGQRRPPSRHALATFIRSAMRTRMPNLSSFLFMYLNIETKSGSDRATLYSRRIFDLTNLNTFAYTL